MNDLLFLARQLIPTVKEAGAIELHYYNNAETMGVTQKKDGSVVTLADSEAEVVIERTLAQLTPHIPVVGEEAVSAGIVPDISAGNFYLVDPLDNTKGFTERKGDFTVNIGLIENGIATMGIIYVPLTGTIYYGAKGRGAFRMNADGVETRITTRLPHSKGLVAVGSPRLEGSPLMEEFSKSYNIVTMLPRSSSLKFCAIAEGDADIFAGLAPTMEWDTAAGEAILRGAGGRVENFDGTPKTYGDISNKFKNKPFVGFSW